MIECDRADVSAHATQPGRREWLSVDLDPVAQIRKLTGHIGSIIELLGQGARISNRQIATSSPAAGQLAADLLSNQTPVVDPTPYRLERL